MPDPHGSRDWQASPNSSVPDSRTLARSSTSIAGAMGRTRSRDTQFQRSRRRCPVPGAACMSLRSPSTTPSGHSRFSVTARLADEEGGRRRVRRKRHRSSRSDRDIWLALRRDTPAVCGSCAPVSASEDLSGRRAERGGGQTRSAPSESLLKPAGETGLEPATPGFGVRRDVTLRHTEAGKPGPNCAAAA